MDDKEKILALQMLLEDMRGSFPLSGYGDRRMVLAKKLADELSLVKHSECIQELADYDDYRDGRHFRTSHEYGGYEGMDVLHGLPRTYSDKSQEFRLMMSESLEYPECRFEDYPA